MMSGKVGFLHDKFLQMGIALSETDDATAPKYNIEVVQSNGSEEENVAELSIIGIDNSLELPTGFYVKCLKTGPLVDRHDNYKDVSSIDLNENYLDFSLGAARYAIKDGTDVVAYKSTDEYWAQNNHETLIQDFVGQDVFQVCHSNGVSLMRSFAVLNTTLDLYEIYVSTRNETTSVWGTPVLVDRVKYKFNTSYGYELMAAKSAFVTIPNLGTLLFYFGLNEDTLLNQETFTEQLVYIAITKDKGTTWSRYNKILIEPYYGGCIPPSNNFLLDKVSCEIKATYFNNKLLIGLMLNGSYESVSFGDQHFPKNILGNDTDTTVLDTIQDMLFCPNNLLKIKKKSVKVYSTPPTISPRTLVAYDNGDGKFTMLAGLDAVTSYINYDTHEIKLEETVATVFGENGSTAPCYVKYEIDGLHLRRFLNLVFSSDLGKSWTTIPAEFLSQTIEGPLPTDRYIFGGEDVSSPYDKYKYAIPSNFGLGYDSSSDKFVLILRGSGVYIDYSTPQLDSLKNISNLFFFYNIDDEMLKWESSKVTGRSFKIIDSYNIDHVTEWYHETHSPIQPAGNWYVENGYLLQTVQTPAVPASATISLDGTHLRYIRSPDPTLNRTIGIHIDICSEGQGGTLGIKFAGGYAVAINVFNELAKIGFKKYSGGSWVNMPGTAEQNLQFSKYSWGSLDIVFKGYSTILIFFNGQLIYTSSDNTYRIGSIYLFADKQPYARFKNLGLLRNTNILNIIGSDKKFSTGAAVGGIGTSIDISTDQYNQSWLAANVAGIELEGASPNSLASFKNYGIAFNKFRLERDIERVEGKFLAKEKYIVKFGDSDYFSEDVGNYFAIHDYGIFPSCYAGYTNPDDRAMLLSHIWHKNNPIFLLKRGSNWEPNKAIVERVGYANRNIFSNFSSIWCSINSDVNPMYSGWDVSGSYTSSLSHIIIVNASSYVYQQYDFTNDVFNSNALKSAPVRYFDIDYRGLILYATLKSDSGNANGNSHTVLEFQMPSIDNIGGNENMYRVRLNFVDGATTGSITMDWYDASTSTWNTSFVTISNVDTKQWCDVMISVLPTKIAGGTLPKISAYYRYHTSRSYWRTILENSSVPQIKSYVGVALGVVKFGSYNETSTPAKTHFKFVGYSDHNFIDLYRNTIRGESLQSGERIYGTKGIIFTLSGGLGIEDDEWHMSDLNYRSYPKGNIFERESVTWRSDDDDADKEIIIDTKQMFEYDTIILTGINCRYITVEANDTNVWTSPALQMNIDMVEIPDLYISKYLATLYLLRIHASEDDYAQDFLLNKLVCGQEITHGTYRIISNVNRCIKYSSVYADAIPSADWTVQVLGTRIAIKLANRTRNRYFRIVFKNAGLSYPTPDGYFKLGQFAAGVFDELQWNPEYPEETNHTHHVKKMKSMGNSSRFKRLGPVTRSKNLQFNAIDNRDRGFAEQLIAIFRHAADDRVFYIPNIYERILSGAGVYGTYTFELMNCFLPDKLRHAIDWGTLSSLTFELTETD